MSATSIESIIIYSLKSNPESSYQSRFYNRTTRPTRFGTSGESSSSLLLFALPVVCAWSPCLNEGLISLYLPWLAPVALLGEADAKVYWRRKALVLPSLLLVRSCAAVVVLGRASVTTTEHDRRRRERASLRAAADEREHMIALVLVDCAVLVVMLRYLMEV